MTTEDKKELTNEDQIRKDRREFLGKSKYAIYMTPVMLSMVVDKDASAGTNSCINNPNSPNCPAI